MDNASDSLLRCPIHTGRGDHPYDVFLSYNRSDTGKKFADHLYHSLVSAGTIPIMVFRDVKSITIGEPFGKQILDAISRSKVSIPIISKNYAARKWCLRELVHMMKRRASSSHVVLPIFYEVEPSDVGELQGEFGSAYHSHKNGFGKNDKGEEYIPLFEQALEGVSRLEVWPSEKIAGGREGEFVKIVVDTVRGELRRDFQLDVTEDLVGIDDHVKKIKNWAKSLATHARMIGIYGMGGIGKTTLAKAIYNELSKVFVDRSYIPDIRDTADRKGIHCVQSQLIEGILPNEREVSSVDLGVSLIQSGFKGKKVLILLDDIDGGRKGREQLDALARKRDWFMAGSIIIVTTRYRDVLDQSKFGDVYKYELNELDMERSVLLFNRHAFRMNCSLWNFKDASREIISTMGGLPLALVVVGSYLFGKTNPKVWTDTLKQLRDQPHEDVQEKLMISYNALKAGHKEIFLDIACFFVGKKSEFAMYMWDECGFYASQGIEELKLRCLIKIGDDDELKMHHQLRHLGRSIVTRVQPLERRSRLWVYNEASAVLMEKKGTQSIKAISLDEYHDHPSPDYRELQEYTSEQFENLKSLRFLELWRAALNGDFNQLFSELRWLRWSGIEPVSFSATNLLLPNLLVLQMSGNGITEHWGGWSSIMVAKRLKVLNLAYCRYLICTPDLSAFTELEILILNGCGKLKQLHPSVGKVKSLVSLNLSDCINLKKLPKEVGGLEELKELLLDHSGITKFPASIGSLSKLEKLSAKDCSSLREVPSSIWNLHNLQHLHFDYSAIEKFGSLKKSHPSAFPNDEFEQIHPSIGKSRSLVSLGLRCCESLKELPEEVGELEELKELILDYSGLMKIPTSIGSLKNLEKLSAHRCSSLREIPSTIGNLQSLQHLDLGHSAIEKLPTSIGRLKKMQTLKLQSCESLKGKIPSEIDDLSSLEILDFSRAAISYLPKSIRNLSSLQHLSMSFCDRLLSLPELPSSLTYLTASGWSPELPQLSRLIHLEQLHLHQCYKVEKLPELPSSLVILSFALCSELTLPKLDGFKHLEELSIDTCSFIKRLDLSQLNRLKRLHVMKCYTLDEIRGHNNLELLEKISVIDCKSIRRLILPKLQRLKHLTAILCRNLVEIQGLDMAELLETLNISNCGSIERLPELSCFATLKVLNIKGCKSLEELPKLSKFENLRIIR